MCFHARIDEKEVTLITLVNQNWVVGGPPSAFQVYVTYRSRSPHIMRETNIMLFLGLSGMVSYNFSLAKHVKLMYDRVMQWRLERFSENENA